MYSSRFKLPEYTIPPELKSMLLNTAGSNKEVSLRSQHFARVLKKIKDIDQLELAECHYLQFLKLGLYLEEFEYNINMTKYELYYTKLEKVIGTWGKFKITVNDLDKDNPIINSSDLIEIRESNSIVKSNFILRVVNVLDDHVIATSDKRFYESYNANNFYDIKFRSNNYIFICCHYALSLINSQKMAPYLFPRKKQNTVPETTNNDQQWFNKSISHNPEQKQAVLNIVRKSSCPAPYILYGPPGTGKTATLVEAICQVCHTSDNFILICTPSNAACDVITKRLLDYIPAENLYRIYSQSKDFEKIDEGIKQCCNYKDGHYEKLEKEIISTKEIVITTLCTCTRLINLDLTVTYSYIFIDEAGQSMQPESLIPFNLINSSGSTRCQIVISGDPQQLGPGIRSKLAEPILGQSILERLMKCEPYKRDANNEYDSCYIVKLIRNYRNHSAIIRVPNELFYQNELITCSSSIPLIMKFPIIFHGVAGEEEKIPNSMSSYNSAEISKVLEYVHALVGKKVGDKVLKAQDIGIVTPFSLQSLKLRKMLRNENLNDIMVGTVEIFQGQEKDVMILSTVRTKMFMHDDRKDIGFLSNPRRFNVALTRAKALLIVIGDPAILQADKYWCYFLNFCHKNNACRGVGFELMTDIFRVDVKRRSEVSTNLFSMTYKILEIDDGVVGYSKRQFTNTDLRFPSEPVSQSSNQFIPRNNADKYCNDGDEILNEKISQCTEISNCDKELSNTLTSDHCNSTTYNISKCYIL